MAIESENTHSDGIEGRVARIEGALPYLATKEDVAELKAELTTLKWAFYSEMGIGTCKRGYTYDYPRLD